MITLNKFAILMQITDLDEMSKVVNKLSERDVKTMLTSLLFSWNRQRLDNPNTTVILSEGSRHNGQDYKS